MTEPFDGLENAIWANLPRHLPGGARLTSVRLGETELRVVASKSFFTLTLTAQVLRSPGTVRLHSFMLDGAFGMGGAALRDEIARIDAAWPPYRAKGGDGGASLVFTRG